MQKLRDYQNSPEYSREGEYKYLKGDDKDYYGTKWWNRLKYKEKPGSMTQAEWHWRNTMDENDTTKINDLHISETRLCSFIEKITRKVLNEIINKTK